MKPMLIALALLAGTFTKSLASDGITTVDPSVLKSFTATFATAKEVDWTTTEDVYKAVFMLNGQYLTAYYRADGTMQALTRHISANNLPVLLQAGLKNTGNGQWVSDVVEVTRDGVVQYYAVLEDAQTQVVMKSAATSWNVYKKQRKD